MLEQNSVVWLDWRKNGVGASDIPIIINESKYKTRYRLFQEKTGQIEEKKSENYIQEVGHIIEKEARKIYEIMIGDSCEAICVQHKSYDWCRASLDGHDKKNNLIWECKLVGKKEFEDPEIIKKFYAQIQWQMFVSGIEKAVLFLCLHEKRKLKDFRKVDVAVDKDYIMNLFIEAKKFWDVVKSRVYDLEIPQEIKDVKVQRLLLEYLELKNKIKEFAEACDAVEKEIFANTKHNDHYRGFKIIETTRKGAIDYKLIEELKDIDLEKYRKPETKYKTIKIGAEE